MAVALPRGPDGKIIVDLIDTAPLNPDPPAESAAPAAPAAPPPAAPAAPRRDTPTPFGELLRPAQVERQPHPHREAVTLAVAGLLIVAILSLAAWALWPRPAPALKPTPAAAPTVPVDAPAPAVALSLERAVVAFDAPGGAALGALEPGRAYTLAQERGDWRQLAMAGSGLVWVRAWELDGTPPPTPTRIPTSRPAPPPVPWTPPAPAPAVVPVGPAVTCLPAFDQTGGANVYLGEACGVTRAEREQRAFELLQAAPPPPLERVP